MAQLLKNPFHIYWVSYLFVFFVYNFGWADMYPELTWDTILFFVISSLIAFFLGFIVKNLRLIGSPSDYKETKLRTVRSFFFVSIGLFLIEFIILRGIPLLELFKTNPRFVYMEFGIFIYHPLCISFCMFSILFIFNAYLKSDYNKKKILIYYILSYIPSILIINRNMMIASILASFFLFIHYNSKKIFKPKILLSAVFIALLGMYFFGLFGNLRSFKGNNKVIVEMAGGTEEFKNSMIPNEFFWVYLYLSSPTANLQHSVNVVEEVPYDFPKMFLYEFTPRKISELIVYTFDVDDKPEKVLIKKWLNMAGVYGNSYLFAKWWGVTLMFVYSMFFISIFIFIVPKKSGYHLLAISVVSTIIFLNTFANFFYVMTVSFELFFIFLFALFENKKFVLKTNK